MKKTALRQLVMFNPGGMLDSLWDSFKKKRWPEFNTDELNQTLPRQAGIWVQF